MKISSLLLYLLLVGVASVGCFTASETGNEQAVANERAPVEAISQNAAMPVPDQAPPAGGLAERVNRLKPREVPASGTPVPLVFTDAGENSQTASTMDSDGSVREIRVFRSHPVLSKVELIWLTPRDKVLKVTLKDGKTVETQTDRIENLKQATAATILSVAGIGNAAGQTRPPRGAARP